MTPLNNDDLDKVRQSPGKHGDKGDNAVALAEIKKEEKMHERILLDRRHERSWVGWIIVIALCSSIGCFFFREGGKDFALAILNIASVGLGYFAGQHTKS
jgi:hypothetical protein